MKDRIGKVPTRKESPMTENDFVAEVFTIAEAMGFTIETCRGKGYPQIDFGHKKLHSEHIRALYPEVLQEGAKIGRLIEDVAPGRPCSHAPFKKIVAQIHRREWLS